MKNTIVKRPEVCAFTGNTLIMQNDKNKIADKKDNDGSIVKPDPETLHTTDPEEHMRGPLSSLMLDIMEEAEKEDSPEKTKE